MAKPRDGYRVGAPSRPLRLTASRDLLEEFKRSEAKLEADLASDDRYTVETAYARALGRLQGLLELAAQEARDSAQRRRERRARSRLPLR